MGGIYVFYFARQLGASWRRRREARTQSVCLSVVFSTDLFLFLPFALRFGYAACTIIVPVVGTFGVLRSVGATLYYPLRSLFYHSSETQRDTVDLPLSAQVSKFNAGSTQLWRTMTRNPRAPRCPDAFATGRVAEAICATSETRILLMNSLTV
jgi:hypothetical protein